MHPANTLHYTASPLPFAAITPPTLPQNLRSKHTTPPLILPSQTQRLRSYCRSSLTVRHSAIASIAPLTSPITVRHRTIASVAPLTPPDNPILSLPSHQLILPPTLTWPITQTLRQQPVPHHRSPAYQHRRRIGLIVPPDPTALLQNPQKKRTPPLLITSSQTQRPLSFLCSSPTQPFPHHRFTAYQHRRLHIGQIAPPSNSVNSRNQHLSPLFKLTQRHRQQLLHRRQHNLHHNNRTCSIHSPQDNITLQLGLHHPTTLTCIQQTAFWKTQQTPYHGCK